MLTSRSAARLSLGAAAMLTAACGASGGGSTGTASAQATSAQTAVGGGGASSKSSLSSGGTGGTTGGIAAGTMGAAAGSGSAGGSSSVAETASASGGALSASGMAASNSSGGSAGSGAASSAGTASSGGSSGGTAGSGLWVMGYYVGWEAAAYPVSAVDFAAMTHVALGPVIAQSDGSLDTTFSIDATRGPAWAKSASAAAHQAGDKVLLWVGGSNSEQGFLGAASTANLSRTVSNLTAAMAASGADGLDLDWEPVATADEPSFMALLQALRKAMPGALLTIPVGIINPNYQSVDAFYPEVAPLIDQMNVMTYGMSGAWEGWESWHSAPVSGESPTTPTSIDTSIPAYINAGVPASELGIGIGFYGLCYTPPVTGPKQPLMGSTVAASDGDISFANIMGLYYTPSAHRWDSTAEVPFLSFAEATGPAGCTFISYDDAQSVASKASYARANGLGGVIIWEIAEGYLPAAPAGQENGLMEAIRTSFLR